MMRNNLVPIYLLIILISLHQGLSLKCWKCRSDQDPKCADPFDNSTAPISECKSDNDLINPPLCSKVRQKIHGQWIYVRDCAFRGKPGILGDERFCLSRTGSYNLFMEYCTCNSKDGCNVGSSLNSSIISIILALTVGYFFIFIKY